MDRCHVLQPDKKSALDWGWHPLLTSCTTMGLTWLLPTFLLNLVQHFILTSTHACEFLSVISWLGSMFQASSTTVPACTAPGKGPPAALAASDLAGDMELLAVTAPEEAGKDATESQTAVEGAEKAVAMPEVESPVGTGLGGKVVTPEGAAAIVAGASESPAAERVAEAFARAAERIAVSEVAKVLQSAIAELKGKRRSMWIKPRNATQREEDWMKEGEVK
ncbi:uncharacterized protein ACIQIH_012444 isoform 1-T1 [Cyanocitta cristata]